MSLIEEGFSSKLEATAAVGVDSVGLDGEFGPGVKRAFFEGEGLIVIDSDRCLCYFSRNLALKLEVISFSSFSSQIIRGTSRSTLASTSSLENEDDEEDEGEEVDDEDRVAGSGVLAFWMRQAASFFFWVR